MYDTIRFSTLETKGSLMSKNSTELNLLMIEKMQQFVSAYEKPQII